MLDYPDPLKAFPLEWVAELLQIRDLPDLLLLEKKDVTTLPLSSELKSFFSRADELAQFPHVPPSPTMPETSFTFLHVIPKKQHEIRILAPFVKRVFDEKSLRSVVDIGGGIGALAQTLSGQYSLPVKSVDMDPVLQQTGQDRQKRSARHRSVLVDYHNHRVTAESEEFKRLLGPGVLTLGLHTCGDLSLHQIQASISSETQSLINIGCCYQRLTDETQNVSHFARTLPTMVTQNQFALTLAARAHRKTSEADFGFKLKVKYFRYAMHILLHDHYGQAGIVTLGNSSRKLYDRPFSTYALEQIHRLGLTPLTAEALDAFYGDPGRQELIRAMLTAGFIRNVFGRLLEVYIILDRAIYLDEAGYKTQLLTFFDELVSPRNLALVAEKT